MVRAGELRQRVEIHAPSETTADDGETITTFGKIESGGDRWASIEPLSGNEQLVANQTEARVSHRIGMRKPDDVTITPVMQIVEGERIFHIERVIDPDERRRELELLCVEVI